MPIIKKIAKEMPPLLFEGKEEWEGWLKKNHSTSCGIWMVFAKKGSGKQSVTYAEALEAALCHGWIDGQRQRHTEETFVVKFTPRGPRSIWSKINRDKALKLIASGEMREAGLKAIENAKKNGRWDSAYDSARTAKVPEEFQAALDANPKAKAFFETLNSTNRYSFLFRIQTAKKAETRERRITEFIRMLKAKQKFHP
jgi:uncharacterized protein YdeI (YjbR/CyaY-like superfamily)